LVIQIYLISNKICDDENDEDDDNIEGEPIASADLSLATLLNSLEMSVALILTLLGSYSRISLDPGDLQQLLGHQSLLSDAEHVQVCVG